MLKSRKVIRAVFFMVCAMVPGVSSARGEEVDARLHFMVWNMGVSKGVQVADGEVKSEVDKRVEGEFYLKVGENYVKVNYKEGRRSPAYMYSGSKQCVFYVREQAPDAKEEVFRSVGQVQLPGSGEFAVVLRTQGGGNARLNPLLLPYGDDFLAKGMISVVNYTDREVVVVPDNRKMKLELKPMGRGNIRLKAEDATGIYLQVFSRKSAGDAWKVEFSRAYTVFKDSKNACILYQDKADGGVRVKLYSGLER